MKKTRLQKVVDHLRKVRIQIAKYNAPEFNMNTWGTLEEGGVFKGKKNLKCVTSACAIGHTAHLFANQGFKLEISPDRNDILIPVYKKLIEFNAIAEFFDITPNEAHNLFHPGGFTGEATVGEVADRIEDFINGI